MTMALLDDWPTKESDLSLATTIMQKYSRFKDSLTLLDGYELTTSEQTLKIILPEWIEELALKLKLVHGDQVYPFILNKIMKEILMNCMTRRILTPEQSQLLEALWMSSWQTDSNANIH